jgi:transposase InsO family protein
MKQKINNTEKQNLIQRYHAGESATNICFQFGIPRSTFYTWIKPQKTIYTETTQQIIRPSEFNKLSRRVKRLEQLIEVLKKVKCTATSPLQEKLTALERIYGQYSVRVMCDALDVSRGTFYNHIFRNKRENNSYQFRRIQLSEQIKQVYDESNQIYGAKKIKAILSERGIVTSNRMVAELMGEMNIGSIRLDAKKNYNRFNPKKKKDALSLNFTAKSPNAVWVSDTTYFKVNEKIYYICAIIDLYSRKVISHKISSRHSTQLITGTFKLAYVSRSPAADLIFHSDRGVQYTSHSFQKLLAGCNINQSFSPSGSPQHNAIMESFFSSMKREELYRKDYHSVQEFKESLSRYIDFYNIERPHTTLNYKSPNAHERLYYERKNCKDTLDNPVQILKF